MKYINYIYLLLFVFVFQSCGTMTRNKAFHPDTTQLIIQMDDLEYVGETKVDVSYRTYLGFIRRIDDVNGKQYDATDKSRTTLEGATVLARGLLKKALYKVLEEHPDAQYYQVVNVTRTKEKLFLGNFSKQTAVIRAYKFKNKNR